MVFRHGHHLETDIHQHRETIILNRSSTCIVDIILRIVMIVHRIDGDHLMGAWNQSHIGVVITTTVRVETIHKESENIIVLSIDILRIFLRTKHIVERQKGIPWNEVELKHCHIVNPARSQIRQTLVIIIATAWKITS